MLCLFAAVALAQESRSVSLEEAFALYREASESLTIAQANVDRADAEKSAAFGGFLPAIGASVSYSHTFLSEYDGLFDAGGTGTPTGTSYGGAASNPFADLPFGQPDTWRVDFSLSQVVYGGGRVHAQNQLARASLDAARLGEDTTRASTLLDVAAAYLDTQLTERVLGIAQSGLEQAETTHRHAEAAAQVGRQPEFEVLRARVEVENQKVLVLQQQRVHALAELRLKQLLGLPATTALTLTTPLDRDAPELAAPGEGERLAVRQVQAGVAAAEAAVRLNRAAGLPQVAVSAAGGFVAYPDDPLPPTEDWRTNLTAGGSVSMPIFGGGVVRARVSAAQADLTAARARAAQAVELADLDTQDALSALATARAQWEATATTVEQAERAYAIAEVRFQEGISPQSEVSDARLLLMRATANRAQAGRDLQLAALRVQLLHDLPLSAR